MRALNSLLPALVIVAVCLLATIGRGASRPATTWALRSALQDLRFVDPVRILRDPRPDQHFIYVVCKNGEIFRVDLAQSPLRKELFIDIKDRVQIGGDTGLTGLAFHPNFANSQLPQSRSVYLLYQYSPAPQFDPNTVNDDLDSYARVSQFSTSADYAHVDASSETVLIQQFDQQLWHTLGDLHFGPDRMLYIVLGDEGAEQFTEASTQSITDRLFSGVLRIDVDNDPARSHPIKRQPRASTVPAGWPQTVTRGYGIPNDNPWVTANDDNLEEFWAIGLRSPFTSFFDRTRPGLWIADVGQNTREEITFVEKGDNAEWPFREGSVGGPLPPPATILGRQKAPWYDYGRASGSCIIGGFVYNGQRYANALSEKLLYADHITGKVFALDTNGDHAALPLLVATDPDVGYKKGIACFFQGDAGEIYLCHVNGTNSDQGRILELYAAPTI